jgi:hypothetical protein
VDVVEFYAASVLPELVASAAAANAGSPQVRRLFIIVIVMVVVVVVMCCKCCCFRVDNNDHDRYSRSVSWCWPPTHFASRPYSAKRCRLKRNS